MTWGAAGLLVCSSSDPSEGMLAASRSFIQQLYHGSRDAPKSRYYKNYQQSYSIANIFPISHWDTDYMQSTQVSGLGGGHEACWSLYNSVLSTVQEKQAQSRMNARGQLQSWHV